MRTLVWLLAAIPGASTPSMAGRDFNPPSSAPGIVAGRVVNSSDEKPVAGASVILPRIRKGAATDELGFFELKDVPAGVYELRILHIGMEPLTMTVEVEPGRATRVRATVEAPCWLDTTRFVRPVGTRAAVRESELNCTITPAKARFRVGDRPEFSVRIRNDGPTSAILVRSLDRSAYGVRFPMAVLRLHVPISSLETVGRGFCGLTAGISPDDFVTVAPGESFDPYESGWGPHWLRDTKILKPGEYQVSFRYATNNQNMRKWLGTWWECEVPIWLTERIAEVPAVDIHCATTFEVVP